MSIADADAVVAVVEAANADAHGRAGRDAPPLTAAERRMFVRAMARFAEHDPEGAWVAVDGGVVVGMAEAIRRGGFWGLSMLFVSPDRQSRGVGRALLERAMGCGRGAKVRMIVSSSDPRALRRYWAAGLTLHPTVEAAGAVDRRVVSFPDLPGRPGDAGDLDLVADVDEGLRGSRAEDVEFLVSIGAELDVVDGPRGRGYAVRRDGRLQMLGATDEEVAKVLVWRYLAAVEGTARITTVTAAQGWAVDVAMAAGLSVRPQGALFVDGMDRPPGPWLCSGWFF
jgi:ribosomal protein S18 acetylase RimI-like enzyme